MNKFKKDLELGKKYEYKSIDILKKYGYINIEIDDTYNPYYDLTAYKNEKKVYFEVKYNALGDKLKTVFLECCKYPKLYQSGISITKANYYILFTNTKYYICGTDKLKNILKKTIQKKLKANGLKHIKDEHLISYIEHEGKRTKNSIGILIDVEDVKRKCKYKGSI